ncbi:phosphoglycerate mutase-like protein [Trichodelitschia bisporula]|uniref:Phosphoglycerate mutase-like protein n=1 Tax=Trichodelitschia bisporula TaxID=703511 RepID=A0A6G1HZR9_9PEZI|nr:phosphoglycerate mutase-like protein [Trichodelitschia bisporula]
MLTLYATLLVFLWLEGVSAQTVFTVHSTVIFARVGDRTPLSTDDPVQLTSLGAQQMYNLGSFLRRRYITSGDTNPFVGAGVIAGLSSWHLSPQQLYVLTENTQSTTASALAFMQGFYPPFQLPNGTAKYIDPSSLVANNSYVEYPLNGYQYPSINAVSELDPNSIFVAGNDNCDNYYESGGTYTSSIQFSYIQNQTHDFYQSIGRAILGDDMNPSGWDYAYATDIYDFVSYQNRHNDTVAAILSRAEFKGVVDELANLASMKQWELNGNSSDGIRTIAGQTLAAKVLGLFASNMVYAGYQNKVNLIVGDFAPMIALFSLMNLSSINSNFRLIPPFGSAIALELFSINNSTGVGSGDGANYPNADSLWVRFLYTNGSTTDANPNPTAQTYQMFNNGPSGINMKFKEFAAAVEDIMLSDVSRWCILCSSTRIFCPGFTGSDGSNASDASRKHGLSLQAAGVLGAGVTLAVLLLLLALAMLVGGVRFRRRVGGLRRRSDLGGFKGSAKLASDTDLNIPKNAAPIGIVSEDVKKGHERVGSWELKSKDAPAGDRFGSLADRAVGADRRPSYELDDDEERIDPFQQPVKPVERV